MVFASRLESLLSQQAAVENRNRELQLQIEQLSGLEAEQIRLEEQLKSAVQQEQQAQLAQQHQRYLAEQQQQLLERIPEWRNEETAAKEKQNVIMYAQRVGYSEQELATASDSRAIEALRKAYLYDELMAKKPAAQKKVTKAPKAVKSGTPKTKKQANANRGKQALERLNKTGSKDAAVDLLLQRMRD